MSRRARIQGLLRFRSGIVPGTYEEGGPDDARGRDRDHPGRDAGRGLRFRARRHAVHQGRYEDRSRHQGGGHRGRDDRDRRRQVLRTSRIGRDALPVGSVQADRRHAGAWRAEVFERVVRHRARRGWDTRTSRRGDGDGHGARGAALRQRVPHLARELRTSGSNRDQAAHGVGGAGPAVPGDALLVSDILLTKKENGVLWLTLNRPERKNSISPELREELLTALDDARTDDEIRCVVVTGAGDAFCSGVDLGRSKVTEGAARAEPQRPDLRAIREAMKRGMQRVIRAIWELDKPVIASVNGVAAGGGAQLALVCDLVVASTHARLIEIFVKRGLAVDSGGG